MAIHVATPRKYMDCHAALAMPDLWFMVSMQFRQPKQAVRNDAVVICVAFHYFSDLMVFCTCAWSSACCASGGM